MCSSLQSGCDHSQSLQYLGDDGMATLQVGVGAGGHGHVEGEHAPLPSAQLHALLDGVGLEGGRVHAGAHVLKSKVVGVLDRHLHRDAVFGEGTSV